MLGITREQAGTVAPMYSLAGSHEGWRRRRSSGKVFKWVRTRTAPGGGLPPKVKK